MLKLLIFALLVVLRRVFNFTKGSLCFLNIKKLVLSLLNICVFLKSNVEREASLENSMFNVAGSNCLSE